VSHVLRFGVVLGRNADIALKTIQMPEQENDQNNAVQRGDIPGAVRRGAVGHGTTYSSIATFPLCTLPPC